MAKPRRKAPKAAKLSPASAAKILAAVNRKFGKG